MKNSIKYILLALLFCNAAYSQTNFELVVPLRTYHLDRDYIERYADNEGGDIGAILNITVDKGTFISTNYVAGIFRNSYGDLSYTAQYGKYFDITKKLKFGLSIGIAGGYEKAYEVIYEHEGNKYRWTEDDLIENLGFLQSYGVIPTYNFSLTYMSIKNVGVILNANKYYLNAGLVINLSNIIKRK